MTLETAGIAMLLGVVIVMGIIYLVDKNSNKQAH